MAQVATDSRTYVTQPQGNYLTPNIRDKLRPANPESARWPGLRCIDRPAGDAGTRLTPIG